MISKESLLGYKFHETSRFIDNLCKINDNGEFSPSYKYIYLKKLELLDYQGEHATFLDLDIT